MRNVFKIFWYGFAIGFSLAILYVSIRTQVKSEQQQYDEPVATDQPQGVVQAEIPTRTPLPTQNTAVASYYDQSVCENREICQTANGEIFNEADLTFAHISMGFNTRVRFCHNGSCAVCRANDRGPYIAGRTFDLSYGCAEAIGLLQKGVGAVTWEKVKE